MPRTTINGAELNYELTGAGPAVALIHEGVCDMRMWDEHVGALVEEFTVLRYDLRGYGGSTFPPGPFSHVRDLLRLLDHVGLERAALVGASLGGRVALETAFLAPHRVTALCLVAPALRDYPWSSDMREFGAKEDRLLDAGDIEAAIDLNVRLWVDGPKRGPDSGRGDARARVSEMQRTAFEIQLAAYAMDPEPGPEDPVALRPTDVSAPTLVIVGDADVPDFLQIAETLENELPDARRVVLEDVAHSVPLERPSDFRRLALEFLLEQAADRQH